jgi:hypothetical protein
MGDVSRAARRIAQGLLVLLALVFPFETPLFHVGPLQITTVELVLYATLAAWGVAIGIESLRVRGRWGAREVLVELMRDDMARAAVLWAVVLFASAGAAPSDRPAAFKFALRSLSGVLAFFATRSLARPAVQGRRVLLALVVGGLISAATAVAEWVAPGDVPALRVFHDGAFVAFGLRRASGVFAYPTIGAMYWEAVLPLLLVAPFVQGARAGSRARRAALLAVIASAGLVAAILASATRAALAGAVVACGMVAVFGRRSGPLVPRAAIGSLVALAALSVVALGSGSSDSPLAQRLRWWHDDRWYGVSYEVPVAPRTVHGAEVFDVVVTLRNTGTIAWRHDGARPTRLAYHWLLAPAGSSPSRLVDFDGLRTALPEDVPPGGVVRVVGVARAPDAAGAYRLSWDLVQEEVTWFSERGSAMAEQPIEVVDAHGPPMAEVAPPAGAPPAPSRAALWRVAITLWRQRPILGIGPDDFRRRYEALLPPSPTGRPYEDTRIHANNLYFETLADTGLTGLAALAALGLALTRALRRHAMRSLAGLGCAVAATTFFVHGLLDYFFEFTPLYGLFWVTLGLTAAFGQEPAPSPASQDSPR